MSFRRHDPKTYGITAQLREVRREIAMRERVYERWVDDGKLHPNDAARQLAAMQAVAASLERLEREERLL